ncbi:V-set and immunoglobulin domain-containing protein 1 Cortical thymocyte marker CTX Precursor [Larimichthys crocea]|nr:V-set and immunoglobulin domain-containing protein 1 Cortical thymocyte marker CTX Precursor [Larimichthys crocea]
MCSTLHLVVLISMIGCVDLITVSTPHKRVNVTVGESVLLQCMFDTISDTKGLTIQWDFDSPSSIAPQQVYYYQAGNYVVTTYKDRLELPSSPATTRNASIIIRNMQLSDTGVYTCEVHNIPDVTGKSQVTILVNVHERPSTPYCSTHGNVETGHLVTLTCHSEEGVPPPMYTWTRLDQAKTRRTMLGMMTKSGKLEFRNISQFEFGEYQCNATNSVGFAICTIELSADSGDGVVAGAVIGALLGCVLIILVVWFIAHALKKHKYKAVKAAEANEMKRSPHQAQEASDGVPMATRGSSLHAEGDEPQA